ncbi:MAG: hypothetical protein ACRDTA_02635 [Pseudonocardiaceae bacterium]
MRPADPRCGLDDQWRRGGRVVRELPGRGDRAVSGRAISDPWRDVDGTHIPLGCCVEQVEVAKEHGALRSRLGKRGPVLRRSATRLVVRFAGERELARIHPHLVRVAR